MCGSKKGDQKLQVNCADIGDVELIRVLHYSSFGKEKKNPPMCKKLHVGGIEGISCQYLQVMMTNLLQKHWKLQEYRSPIMKHDSVVRPTIYLTSEMLLHISEEDGTEKILSKFNVNCNFLEERHE